MTALLCPENPGHGLMKHVIITQGDIVLGCCWFCVRDDENKPDYCDGCMDCDCPSGKPEDRQLSLFEVEQG